MYLALGVGQAGHDSLERRAHVDIDRILDVVVNPRLWLLFGFKLKALFGAR
jgi:hypothetical protein